METKFNALCALVALQNWKSYNFQIAKQSNLSSTSEFWFGSRSQSLDARGLNFLNQNPHLCLKGGNLLKSVQRISVRHQHMNFFKKGFFHKTFFLHGLGVNINDLCQGPSPFSAF